MSVHPDDIENVAAFIKMITEDYIPVDDLRKLVADVEKEKPHTGLEDAVHEYAIFKGKTLVLDRIKKLLENK